MFIKTIQPKAQVPSLICKQNNDINHQHHHRFTAIIQISRHLQLRTQQQQQRPFNGL